MKKKLFCILILVLIAALLCGCSGSKLTVPSESESLPSGETLSGGTSDDASSVTAPDSPDSPATPDTGSSGDPTVPDTPTLPTTDDPTTPVVTPTVPDTPSVSASESDQGSKETTPPDAYRAFVPEEKLVAITFDDGPCWITPQILDVIDGTDDKVTFFIIGNKFDENKLSYPSYVKRAFDMGCEIGSHTESHQTITNLSDTKLQTELDKVQTRFQALTGSSLFLLRPPGGAFKNTKNYGYAVIDWSLDSNDWSIYNKYSSEHKTENGTGLFMTRGDDHREEREKYATIAAREVADRVVSRVKPGDIVLMHDIWFPNTEAFAMIYSELKAQGYRFVTVSELLNIDPSQYAGWYFNSTSDCGHDGANLSFTASAPASASPAPFAALPPEKIN